jgi:Glycosyltransferase family 87
MKTRQMTSSDMVTDFGEMASGARRPKAFAVFRDALIPAGLAVAAMIAGAVYSWFQGLDANWDWQNYHEYNVWAVINDRYGTDVLPAGFQNYFNPVVYFPVYYLRHFVPAPYGALIIGAIHGLNLVLIYFMTRVLLREAATASAIAAAVLIAASGPMTLVETGTSFADILTALPVIAGFVLIVSAEEQNWPRYILAGLLIGAAVGLKLTNVVFALGAAACLLVSARPLLAIPCLAIGGAIGAAATGGAWSVMLWREMGNPIFPLFNGFMPSKEMQPVNFLDLQFTPRSLLDALAYPFYWLMSGTRTAEHPFRDARFANAAVLLLITLAVRIIRQRPILARRDSQFLILFLTSYFAWLGLFAIQRYAVALELLCGPLIVLLVSRLATLASERGAMPKRAGLLTLLMAAAIALWCQPGDWWHRPWSEPYQPRISEALQRPATYFMLDKPVSYIAPQLPPGSRFYQIADIALPILPNGTFDRRIHDGLAHPLPGGVWQLHVRDKAYRQELLSAYGLEADGSKPCVEIEGIVPGTALMACPLTFRNR